MAPDEAKTFQELMKDSSGNIVPTYSMADKEEEVIYTAPDGGQLISPQVNTEEVLDVVTEPKVPPTEKPDVTLEPMD